jgi:hypothetical protein
MGSTSELIVYSLDFMRLYKDLHMKQHASSVRTSSGWKPTFYQDKEEWAVRKTISLANKLSNENFNELSKNFHSLYISAPAALENMCNELYKKALLDKAYVHLYIKMVLQLSKDIKSNKPVLFLQNACLENFKTLETKFSRMDNIRFIANMAKLEVFKVNKVIRTIIPDLIDSQRIEELCMLIEITLELLEKHLKNKLRQVIDEMYKLSNSKRIQFMVDDLKAKLRANKPRINVRPRWEKKKSKQNQGYSSRKRPEFYRATKNNPPPKEKTTNPWKPKHLRKEPAVTAPAPKQVQVNETETLYKQVKETILEYIDTNDKEEVKTCFEELKEKASSKLLYYAFEVSLSQKSLAQKEIIGLITWLFQIKYFTANDWKDCSTEINKNLANLSLDFPLAKRTFDTWDSVEKCQLA